MAAATTNLTWNPKLPVKSLHHLPSFGCNPRPLRHPSTFSARAFRQSDLDNFARRLASGEAWRDAWRSANNGFEVFIFEARKTAERIDRRYSVSRRLGDVAQSATDRARDLDREFEIRQRWRSFTIDFIRNWPRYRKELNCFFDTPLGRGFAAISVLWFILSGWLFRCLIFATWILPFAGPLLIGTVANNLIIKLVKDSLWATRIKQFVVLDAATLYGSPRGTSREGVEVPEALDQSHLNLTLLMLIWRKNEKGVGRI